MEKVTMKKQSNALIKMVFGLALLFAGVQCAFASLACEGTVYLKLPDGWKTAYAAANGQFTAFSKSKTYDGWVEISTTEIGGANPAKDGFFIASKVNDYGQGPTITRKAIGSAIQSPEKAAFTCADIGGIKNELWIQANPDPTKSDVPYFSTAAADVKYFRIFLPNNVAWKSSVPMIQEDGKPGVAMESDPDRCGWYFRRYIDEVPPTSVLVYRDDDEALAEAIGVNGDWEEGGAASPILLSAYFEMFQTNELFFVAATEFADPTSETMGWTSTDPGVTGDCEYTLAAIIYDTDASLHGAFTCNPDWFQGQTPAQAHANACYYANVPYNVVSSAAGEVPCIGITPGMVESTLTKDANGNKKPKLTSKGQGCFGSNANEAFAAMFNSTPGVNETYCYDLPFKRSDDGKWEFDSDNFQSPGATVSGGFYPAEKTPEQERMMSERLAAAESKRKAEGPVFFCADYNNNSMGGSRTPDGLRTIHATEGIPLSDLICNGPGWEGGIKCDGLFAAGSEFADNNVLTTAGENIQKALGVTWNGDGWGWSCDAMAPIGWTYYTKGTETSVGKLEMKNQKPDGDPRWTSGESDSEILTKGGRNQHFCFESHANFRYKKGLRFSFRGDDDIWVFINNKLAVDLGGTHLAAPGYVDLDKFMGATAEVGQTYDIDIFFCDRRTTMSNVRIKTNMFIQQQSGLSSKTESKAGGKEDYMLVYTKTGDGSCDAAIGSSVETSEMTGEKLMKYLEDLGKTINYFILNARGDTVMTVAEMAESKTYVHGGIDITDRTKPKIDKNKVAPDGKIGPGTYNLVAEVEGRTQKYQFKITGSLEVANKFGVAVDETGNIIGRYGVSSISIAGDTIPVFVSSMITRGEDSLQFDIENAVGQSYNLDITDEAGNPASLTLLYCAEKTPNPVTQALECSKYLPVAGARTIGEGGVDTLYATITVEFLTKQEQKFNLKVSGGSITHTLTFYAPTLVFVKDGTSVEQVMGDPDTLERWTGSKYSFYLLALMPTPAGSYMPCEKCNFSLSLGSKTSAGISIDSSMAFRVENGRATISIYSQKDYPVGDPAATLHVTGPNANLISAIYTPLHFIKPPFPIPVLADIYDVKGKVAVADMNMKSPYFESAQQYLDGIADSLVIYYDRPFYKHPDSLPDHIVVYWDYRDSIEITKDEISAAAMCGKDAGLADTLCLPRLSFVKEFSTDVKTGIAGSLGGSAMLNSWGWAFKGGTKYPLSSPGQIQDRVAPVILSASVYSVKGSSNLNQLTVQLSEPVQVTNGTVAATPFTFYLNSVAELETASDKYNKGVGLAAMGSASITGDSLGTVTVLYDGSGKSFSPHTGDYIRFFDDGFFWTDKSLYLLADGSDTLRSMEDAAMYWNFPTPYNSTLRLPSPWVQVTGEAEVGVKSITYADVAKSNDKVAKITPITSVKGYPVTATFEQVKADNPGVLGFFVKSDINSLIYSDTTYSQALSQLKYDSVGLAQIYVQYELQVFTNLGGFVASETAKIRCNDASVYGVGHNCLDTQRNYFISWNIVSKDHRWAGTGAYIAKLSTYAKLAQFGKHAKLHKTQMWGVHRSKKGAAFVPTTDPNAPIDINLE